MKAVILAGGLGTRLSEETTIKYKPMVGNNFIICCGYPEPWRVALVDTDLRTIWGNLFRRGKQNY